MQPNYTRTLLETRPLRKLCFLFVGVRRHTHGTISHQQEPISHIKQHQQQQRHNAYTKTLQPGSVFPQDKGRQLPPFNLASDVWARHFSLEITCKFT